jgi:MYXO-CTERM domain-containing protein
VCPGVVQGDCHPGYYNCVAGMFVCLGAETGGPEACDGIDNNCNGLVDENLVGPCSTDVGECELGEATCEDGEWIDCTGVLPVDEICDSKDNDCDGETDNDVTEAQAGTECGGSVGDCEPGAWTCIEGEFVCLGEQLGGPEVCDNADNDCDGDIDDGLARSCGTDVGECVTGTETCTAGAWMGCDATFPASEFCDGLDNDCNQQIDDDVQDVWLGTSCGSDEGDCSSGIYICADGAQTCFGADLGGPEECDNADNNCNGMVDEGLSRSCGSDVGECELGAESCVAGAWVGCDDVGPETELCNTFDDNCNGLTDENNPEGGGACGATDVGECDFGVWQCQSGNLVCVGEKTGHDELCDGLDNDCNGVVDEGNPESGQPCGGGGNCASGMTDCQVGVLVCEGSDTSEPEVCNGIDDDCDGVIDDGFPVGGPCGTDEGACSPGIYNCQDDLLNCEGDLGPFEEICNGIDDDCDGDVDDLGMLGPCGKDEGLCKPGMLQCIKGQEVCVDQVPPAPEVCDCKDNNCNGKVDEDPKDGAICPGGALCIDCQCAIPCQESEFGACPTGKFPEEREDGCFCVEAKCDDTACADETVEDDDGNTLCAPGRADVGECMCRQNECTFGCDGMMCPDGTVCSPLTAVCVEDNCRGLGCAQGELCDLTTLECTVDKCAEVECGKDVCREGVCEKSCAEIVCPRGEGCVLGKCEANPCFEVTCVNGDVCDPAEGKCVADACENRGVCMKGELCNPISGECEVDPCNEVVCPEGQSCLAGDCRLPVGTRVDGGVIGEGGKLPPPPDPDVDPEVRVTATGGGGCACNVGARTTAPTPGALLLGMVIVMLFVARRRRSS